MTLSVDARAKELKNDWAKTQIRFDRKKYIDYLNFITINGLNKEIDSFASFVVSREVLLLEKAREEERRLIHAKDLFGLIELRKMVEGKVAVPKRAELLVNWIKTREADAVRLEQKRIFEELERLVNENLDEDGLDLTCSAKDLVYEVKKRVVGGKEK